MQQRIAAASLEPAIQLSLFDPAPSAAATFSVANPAADSDQHPDDQKTQASLPDSGLRSAVPVRSLLSPTEFRHPQADRELRLNDHLVAYSLRRARRRSIGFIVGTEGLSVNAPRWVGIGDIESALREKAGWILRKLGEQRERAFRLHAARVEWRDGIELPYLGQTIVVAVDPQARGALLDPALIDSTAEPLTSQIDPRTADAASGQSRVLRLGLPRDASAAQIRDMVQSWLQRQARDVFETRCQHYAAQLGVSYRRIGLSSAQTRWGSASANGAIRLNWRLIHFGMATLDYVVAHELAHLREMNHSPRFWDIVRSVLPDYRDAMRQLKTEVLPVLD